MSIGRYVAEHGPVRALQYFSKSMDTELTKTMVRRFKKEYLKEILKKIATCKVNKGITNQSITKALPTKNQGRPLLLGQEIDKIVQQISELLVHLLLLLWVHLRE